MVQEWRTLWHLEATNWSKSPQGERERAGPGTNNKERKGSNLKHADGILHKSQPGRWPRTQGTKTVYPLELVRITIHHCTSNPWMFLLKKTQCSLKESSINARQ